MQKWVKNALIGGAAFVAYRLYRLWDMFNSLNWSFQSLRFSRPKIRSLSDSYILTVGFKIYNSSETTIWINSLTGFIEYDGYVLGNYNMGKVRIDKGETRLNVEIDLDPKYVATILIPDLVSRKAPIFTLITNAELFLGIKVRNVFKVNVRDYLPEPVSQLFFK